MNSNLNEHEEKVKKPATVSWQAGDTTHVQTTVIHKRVPSIGVILLTAFTFTVIGIFIASVVFFARFAEVKTIMNAISGAAEAQTTPSGGADAQYTPLPDETASNLPLVTAEPNEKRSQRLPMTENASLSALYESSVNGVVIVENYSRDGDKPTAGSLAGVGTGFVISKDGYIITNAHVISDAKAIWVTMYDSTQIKAELIGSDVATDIAVLKISTNKELTPLPLGDSSEVKTGDFVFAIGHPTGEELGFTATFGMVGAIDRSIVVDGVRNKFIQIDAAINPGNSGGPLFSMDGNVIGVNSAKTVIASIDEYGEPISAEGLGFSLPINEAMRTAKQLIENGGVKRPGIGVSVTVVDEARAEKYNIPKGLLVYTVIKDSPGHKAGLYASDIIVEFDGKKATDNDSFVDYLRGKSVGDSVKIKYWRSGEYRECTVIVGDLNSIGSEILDGAYGGSEFGF